MFFEIGKYGIDFLGFGIDLHIDEKTLLVATLIVVVLRVRKILIDKNKNKI